MGGETVEVSVPVVASTVVPFVQYARIVRSVIALLGTSEEGFFVLEVTVVVDDEFSLADGASLLSFDDVNFSTNVLAASPTLHDGKPCINVNNVRRVTGFVSKSFEENAVFLPSVLLDDDEEVLLVPSVVVGEAVTGGGRDVDEDETRTVVVLTVSVLPSLPVSVVVVAPLLTVEPNVFSICCTKLVTGEWDKEGL